jgi:hypothetical protein
METLSENHTTRSISDHPLYVELGDEDGNPPETPPERREEARVALELLLGGWERAALEAQHITPQHRRVVVKTVARVRRAVEEGTTAYNLLLFVLAPAFLLPGEIEVGTITTGTLEALGIGFAPIDDLGRLYTSVFDAPALDPGQPPLFADK